MRHRETKDRGHLRANLNNESLSLFTESSNGRNTWSPRTSPVSWHILQTSIFQRWRPHWISSRKSTCSSPLAARQKRFTVNTTKSTSRVRPCPWRVDRLGLGQYCLAPLGLSDSEVDDQGWNFQTDKRGVVLMELDLDKLSIGERWTKLRLERDKRGRW